MLLECRPVAGKADAFTLHGHMIGGAEAVLNAAVARAGKAVTLDVSDVTIVNSSGIRDWMAFVLANRKARAITIERCPPHLVLTFNMIRNFLHHVTVRSVLGSFRCPQCRAEALREVAVPGDVDEDGQLRKAPGCARCGTPLAAAFPEDYFAFLAPDDAE